MKLKKLTSLTIVFALVCTINTATFAVDKSVAFESPQDEGPTIVATIKNLKTGEIEFINEVSVTTISSHYLTDANGSQTETVQTSCEAFFPIESNETLLQPLDSESGNKNAGGVTATVTVVYQFNQQQDKIKTIRCYGSWSPDSGLYYLTNRNVVVIPGALTGYSLNKYPTSDYFDYYTGWGYLTRQPDGTYQQQANTYATVYVGGMESAGGYQLSLHLYYGSFS